MRLRSEKQILEKEYLWQHVCQCRLGLVGSIAGHFQSRLPRCFVLLLLFAMAGCAKNVPEPATIRGETMGTTYSIKISPSPEKSVLDELHRKIDTRLEEINNEMSTWRDDSELSRFNKFQKNDWFPVSKETAIVVTEALRIAKLSDGAFDPTVLPLVNLWSFGKVETKKEIPDEHKIQEVLRHIGYRKIRVRLEPPALQKTDIETSLDLSAIAKGFGVDQIDQLLQQEGYANFLVEIGGEIRTRGLKTKKQHWTIGIQSPKMPQPKVYLKVSLSNQSMATSGNYRNYFEVDGKRFSHTINPKTGKPVEHHLASVSVITDDCMTADALATTFMVLGTEKGLELAKRRNIAAYFLERDGETMKESRSTGFSKFIEDSTPSQWSMVFLVTLVVFLTAVLLMAVGVILGKIRIKGTCSGLAGMTDDSGNPLCESCTIPPEECSQFQKAQKNVVENDA